MSFESNIVKNEIAMVKSTANKSSCNSLIIIIIKGDSYFLCWDGRSEILAQYMCREKQSSLSRRFCVPIISNYVVSLSCVLVAVLTVL